VDTPHPVECWFENNFNPNEKIFWIVFSFCHHYEIRGGVANGNLISFSWVLQLTNDFQNTKLPLNYLLTVAVLCYLSIVHWDIYVQSSECFPMLVLQYYSIPEPHTDSFFGPALVYLGIL